MIEITVFATLSALLLFSFIFAGVARFGLLNSYSAYSAKWGRAVPMNNLNLWSVVTFATAIILCPVLIELGVGSMLQFLGFLTPVYLMVVSLTPDWMTKKTQNIVHSVFAILCAIGGLLWVILIMHGFNLLCGVLVFILTLALLTGTVKTAAVFWLEMIMFSSVYLIVLLAVF